MVALEILKIQTLKKGDSLNQLVSTLKVIILANQLALTLTVQHRLIMIKI